MEEVKIKCCTKCKVEKPVEEFHFQNKAKGSLRSRCKYCLAEYDKIRQSTPEAKAKQRERDKIRQSTPEHKAKRRTPEYRAKANQHQKGRIETDSGFKFMRSLRIRQNRVLKGKISTTEGLGLSTQELRDYLESQFTGEMTHENHGIVWELDHKIPMSTIETDPKGNPLDSEHNRKLIYYKNLQPLTVEENRSKGDKILPELMEEFNREDYLEKKQDNE
jgi:hypothetical protein